MLVTWMKTVVMALILYANYAAAVCCKRKGDFGCCGNGPCNIFCCNCDGGCNKQCETTRCSTDQWLQCAVILPLCAVQCGTAVIDPLDVKECKDCLGDLYATCKTCYSTNIAELFLSFSGYSPEAPAYEDNFNALFPSAMVRETEFNDVVQKTAQMHMANNEDFDCNGFMKKNNFKDFDRNGDGFVTVDEACSDETGPGSIGDGSIAVDNMCSGCG